MSLATHSRKGSTSDSDTNYDKQLLEGLGILDTAAVAASGSVGGGLFKCGTPVMYICVDYFPYAVVNLLLLAC